MTPWPMLALALTNAAEPSAGAFGERTAAPVRSVDPDANGHRGDGAYGRFDGDLDLGLGVGPSVAFSGGDVGLALRMTAFWYSTIGVDAVYVETLTTHPDLERRLAIGVTLRPLFLVRWSRALETGPAVLDLSLDSLGLGVGASFATPAGHDFGGRTAFEATLGAGVPLAGTAPGPWLEFRAGVTLPRPVPGEASAMLLLSWHFAVLTPVISGD